MKRTLLLLLALATVALLSAPLFAAGGLAGVWLRANGNSKLTFVCNGNKCTSKVSWLKNPAAKESCGQKRPILGMVNGTVTKSGANVWTGRLYNPEDCKWYSARATVNGNALQLTGGYKVLGQYIGKTANFRRSN